MTKNSPSMKTRINRAIEYDEELMRMGLLPNGIDYNAIISFLEGADYRPPIHKSNGE